MSTSGDIAPIRLEVPLEVQAVADLRIGDSVLLSGVLYGARDSAHRRLLEMTESGVEWPFDPKGAAIYYVGPSPTPPGRVTGAAGPTTSYRMDSFASMTYAHGVLATIGKGQRSEAVRESLQCYGAVHLAATGGAGALLARCIRKVEIVAFPDLGPEALRRFEVEDFPAVVVYDSTGGDLYASGWEKWQR